MMRIALTATTAALTTAMIGSGSAAFADDRNGHTVIFDNSIDPQAADEVLAAAGTVTATESLFVGWQISMQLYQEAVTAGVSGAELSALEDAVVAAATAYEASLIAQNVVQLASAEPVVLTEDAYAELMTAE